MPKVMDFVYCLETIKNGKKFYRIEILNTFDKDFEKGRAEVLKSNLALFGVIYDVTIQKRFMSICNRHGIKTGINYDISYNIIKPVWDSIFGDSATNINIQEGIRESLPNGIMKLIRENMNDPLWMSSLPTMHKILETVKEGFPLDQQTINNLNNLENIILLNGIFTNYPNIINVNKDYDSNLETIERIKLEIDGTDNIENKDERDATLKLLFLNLEKMRSSASTSTMKSIAKLTSLIKQKLNPVDITSNLLMRFLNHLDYDEIITMAKRVSSVTNKVIYASNKTRDQIVESLCRGINVEVIFNKMTILGIRKILIAEGTVPPNFVSKACHIALLRDLIINKLLL